MPPTIDQQLLGLLRGMIAAEASDLHLVTGNRPMHRVHGSLISVGDGPLTADRLNEMLRSIARPQIAQRLETDTDLDFAVQVSDGPLLTEMRAQMKANEDHIGAAVEKIVRSRQFREIRGRDAVYED